jgi:phosphatidylserine/phosphatidylglycerophosphate/cardiolipin synthase-like enzyme
VVSIGAQTYYADVLSAGIRIFRYQTPLHAKTGVIDDIWSTVGSLNLDNVSLKYNFEANIISTEPKFIEDLKTHFLQDTAIAQELTLGMWNKRPWMKQFIAQIY